MDSDSYLMDSECFSPNLTGKGNISCITYLIYKLCKLLYTPPKLDTPASKYLKGDGMPFVPRCTKITRRYVFHMWLSPVFCLVINCKRSLIIFAFRTRSVPRQAYITPLIGGPMENRIRQIITSVGSLFLFSFLEKCFRATSRSRSRPHINTTGRNKLAKRTGSNQWQYFDISNHSGKRI